MNKQLIRSFFVFILLTSCLHSQNLLSGPECVSYDSLHNRYLVSNWNNGNIVAMDSAQNQSYFLQRSGHALGNCIAGNTFYVSIGNTILGVDLDDPTDTVMYLPVAGTTQMDGMTVDDNNNLYVVASIIAKIYKVDLQNQNYSEFVSSGISSRPQDIVYDRKFNRLLVCSWFEDSPIQAISLEDSSLTDLVATPLGNCDGLAIDDSCNYYFSSWTTNSIYSYDTTFTNPPLLGSAGHNGPSNICYNSKDKIIAVPSFNSNAVKFISLYPVAVRESSMTPGNFDLLQNYPNPFNPATTIDYRVFKPGFVSLKVFDVLGNEVATLVNDERESGSYQSLFDAVNLTSGVYFYQLRSNGNVLTKKMTCIK